MLHKRFYCGKYPTIMLEEMLENCKSFEDFEKKCPEEMLKDDRRVGYYLADLLDRYDKKYSLVSEDAMLATAYVGNAVNGRIKDPSRDALISICLAIHATVEETQELLKCAGKAPLYVRKKRDVIIWYGLSKKEPIYQVNANLIERGLTPLFKDS